METSLTTVAEFDPFERTAKAAGLTEEERRDLTTFLAENPEKGDPIKGTGGIRKLRWGREGHGKRGGYRVIYYFYNDTFPVCLLAIYGKNQQVDLTSEQTKQLSRVAAALKAKAKAGGIPAKG